MRLQSPIHPCSPTELLCTVNPVLLHEVSPFEVNRIMEVLPFPTMCGEIGFYFPQRTLLEAAPLWCSVIGEDLFICN